MGKMKCSLGCKLANRDVTQTWLVGRKWGALGLKLKRRFEGRMEEPGVKLMFLVRKV